MAQEITIEQAGEDPISVQRDEGYNCLWIIFNRQVIPVEHSSIPSLIEALTKLAQTK